MRSPIWKIILILHNIRYQKKVDISFQQDLQHIHRIAPLLLIIPLENAFKHGVERLASQAFIDLELTTTPTSILFRIRNNFEPGPSKREGIGLANLKKRLTLLYPNHHRLEINKTTDIFTLTLEIDVL